MSETTRVLFLCTGNSCRSQMAEGFLREIGGEDFEVHSAGTEEERMAVFREVRDMIHQRVRHLVETGEAFNDDGEPVRL